MDILTTLVEVYEQQHYPIDAPDAISAILYYLEARGLSHQDLAASIGSQEQATAILNRQQPLNLDTRAITLPYFSGIIRYGDN